MDWLGAPNQGAVSSRPNGEEIELTVAPPILGGGGDLRRHGSRSSRGAAAGAPRAIPSKPCRTSRPRRRRDLWRRGSRSSRSAAVGPPGTCGVPLGFGRGSSRFTAAAFSWRNPPCMSCRSQPSAQKVNVWRYAAWVPCEIEALSFVHLVPNYCIIVFVSLLVDGSSIW
jgi:hypothetical protein